MIAHAPGRSSIQRCAMCTRGSGSERRNGATRDYTGLHRKVPCQRKAPRASVVRSTTWHWRPENSPRVRGLVWRLPAVARAGGLERDHVVALGDWVVRDHARNRRGRARGGVLTLGGAATGARRSANRSGQISDGSACSAENNVLIVSSVFSSKAATTRPTSSFPPTPRATPPTPAPAPSSRSRPRACCRSA